MILALLWGILYFPQCSFLTTGGATGSLALKHSVSLVCSRFLHDCNLLRCELREYEIKEQKVHYSWTNFLDLTSFHSHYYLSLATPTQPTLEKGNSLDCSTYFGTPPAGVVTTSVSSIKKCMCQTFILWNKSVDFSCIESRSSVYFVCSAVHRCILANLFSIQKVLKSSNSTNRCFSFPKSFTKLACTVQYLP